MKASLRAPSATVAAQLTVPAIVLFGDSVDGNMLLDWCRAHAPNFSLCFDKMWDNQYPKLSSDNCTGYQELLDTLVEPWSMFAGFMSCLPNIDAPVDAPSLVSMYNVWGALNRRPRYNNPAPPAEMTLLDIWAPPFALIPRLLDGKQPNVLLVQSLFWDLFVEQESGLEYIALTSEGNTSLSSIWAERFGSSAGKLLDATAELASSWPHALQMWRTANEVSSAAKGGWQQGANGLIRPSNAAASKAAAQRNVAVFDFLSGTVPLRDHYHPSELISVAAIDHLIADVMHIVSAR